MVERLEHYRICAEETQQQLQEAHFKLQQTEQNLEEARSESKRTMELLEQARHELKTREVGWVNPDHTIAPVGNKIGPFSESIQVGQPIIQSRTISRNSESFAASDVEISTFATRSGDDIEIITQTFAIASIRGARHYATGQPRQDSFSCFQFKGWDVIALADGVSSSSLSHEGSKAAVFALQNAMKNAFENLEIEDPRGWFSVNKAVSRHLVNLFRVRARRETSTTMTVDDRTSAGNLFATTLEVLLVRLDEREPLESRFIYAQIAGDGSLWVRRKDGKLLQLAGDSSHVDGPVLEVSPLPISDEQPRLLFGKLGIGEALIAMTDGIGDDLPYSLDLQRMISTNLSQRITSFSKVLEICSFCLDGANDDRTIAIVQRF